MVIICPSKVESQCSAGNLAGAKGKFRGKILVIRKMLGLKEIGVKYMYVG